MIGLKKQQIGFTIVELLIVIVVIAILAAISTVAYAGIQNRTHDTAVMSDLSALKKKIDLYMVDNVTRPHTPQIRDDIRINAARESYMVMPVTAHNLIYCLDTASTNTYAVVGYSKSGKKFKATHAQGVTEYTSDWTNQNVACEDALAGHGTNFRGYAAEAVDGPWRLWASASQ